MKLWKTDTTVGGVGIAGLSHKNICRAALVVLGLAGEDTEAVKLSVWILAAAGGSANSYSMSTGF